MTAARRRRTSPREQQLDGLEHHRAQMLGLVGRAGLSAELHDAVSLAVEAAMLRRHMRSALGAFEPVQLSRATEILDRSAAVPGGYQGGIRAMTLLAMSQHAAVVGDAQGAFDAATAAVEADRNQWEALANLSRLQLKAKRSLEAFDLALQACATAPLGSHLQSLVDNCEAAFAREFAVRPLAGGV
jgi:hypothetical protein